MQKLVFKNGNGVEIDLTSGDFGITNWEGFSADDLNIQSQQVPMQDGGVFLDSLLEQRELTVTLAMNDNGDLERRYRNRRQLIAALNPKAGEGILTYTNDFISKQIHVIPRLPVFENHNSNDAGTPKALLTWVACNPYWEDIEETSIQVTSFDIAEIKNEGDVPCQVKLDFITDYVEYPTIKNLNNNKKIGYNGNLASNLEVNTNVGKKEVFSYKSGIQLYNSSKNINDICYSEKRNLFVAVGADYTVIASNDGENLEYIEIPREEYNRALKSVVYSEEKDLFVAVGDYGKVLTSGDGFHWSIQTLEMPYHIEKIIYAQNCFIGFCNRYIIKSSNGFDWEVIQIDTGTYNIGLHNAVCVNNETFYGVGSSFYILKSTDLVHWEVTSIDFSAKAITYSQDRNELVVVGGGIAYSTNGTDWTTAQVFTSGYCSDIKWSSYLSKYIAVGLSGGVFTSPRLLISDNAIDWIANTIAPTGVDTFELNCVAISEKQNKVVYAGTEGFIGYFYNTSQFYNTTSYFSKTINKIVYSENLDCYVIIITSYDKGIILYTKDFKSIEQVYIGTHFDYEDLTDCKYISELEKFIVVGSYGSILTSSDGRNWDTQYILDNNEEAIPFGGVAYSKKHKTVYLIGASVYKSTDMINWEIVVSLRNIQHSFFSKGVYCDDLDILVCENSAGWIATVHNNVANFVYLGNTQIYHIAAISYSSYLNTFIIVGDKEYTTKICISRNAEDWETVYTGDVGNLYDVLYDGYKFVVTGSVNGCIILKSTDGKDWVAEHPNIPLGVYFNSITQKLTGCIFGGYEGFIIGDVNEVKNNEIQNLTENSDISLNLEVGNNLLNLTKRGGDCSCIVTYRQKYLGV